MDAQPPALSAPPPAAGMPPAVPARPPRSREPRLPLRARADRRLVIGAAVGGAVFDAAARSGVATIAGTAWVAAAAAALTLSGRARGRAGRLLIAAALIPGLALTLSASPWVTVPATGTAAVLLLLGASLGAGSGGPGVTFPAAAGRVAVALGHLVLAPAMFRAGGGPGGAARDRAAAVTRGALLGLPVMLVTGALLALADPIFRSWFDLAAISQHLVLVLAGAWAVAGLCRAASASRPSPSLPRGPSLGTVEAALVLGGLCGLYAAFTGAQLVALSGAGHRILVTHGLTYAQYARSGFFQLLACAAITLLVLLSVRASADAAHPVLAGLSGLTAALTIGVVAVAIRRLQLYEAVFGLTMLRLACLVAAVWIGVVFVLLALTLPRRGLPPRRLAAAVLISGVTAVSLWGVANPPSIVAQTNLRRAGHGRPLDVREAVSLGPDAIPVLVAGLPRIGAARAGALRQALCARSPEDAAGTAFNVARARAADALARTCGKR